MAEDGFFEPFLLPSNRSTPDRTPVFDVEHGLCRCQARRSECFVAEGKADNNGNGTEE